MPPAPAIQIIPVLDLMNGLVVRGIRGDRAHYRPLQSRLCPGSEPITVAQAIQASFGLEILYIADLDAIRGEQPARGLFAELHSLGFRLWIDAGVRSDGDATKLAQAGIAGIVVGTETIETFSQLQQIVAQQGPDRIILSLDLKNGQPLGSLGSDPITIAGMANSLGIPRLIVLDLAQVGAGRGVGTESLLIELARRFPDLKLIAGGGIRGPDDLARLQACGVSAALVASALHDGRFDEFRAPRA